MSKEKIYTVWALIFFVFSLPVTTVLGVVTLAGGGKEKNYRGVVVGGKGEGFWSEQIINNNVMTYKNKLCFRLVGSRWTFDRMDMFLSNQGTRAEVKAAIDACKPGGATPLKPGEEFQFVYFGHGSNLEFEDGDVGANELGQWLSGFPHSVTIAVILDSCHSRDFALNLADRRVKNKDGAFLDGHHLCAAYASSSADNWLSFYEAWWCHDSFLEDLIDGISRELSKFGIALP